MASWRCSICGCGVPHGYQHFCPNYPGGSWSEHNHPNHHCGLGCVGYPPGYTTPAAMLSEALSALNRIACDDYRGSMPSAIRLALDALERIKTINGGTLPDA